MHTDSDVIDALGGSTAVAMLCKVSPQAVSQWRRDGIPDARRMFLQAVRPGAFSPPMLAGAPTSEVANGA